MTDDSETSYDSQHSIATSNRSSCSSLASRCSSVTFGEIQVREFERIVGDHPGVSDRGPPLAIGWGYNERQAVQVETFEAERRPSRSVGHLQPLKGELRRNILLYGFSVSTDDINESLREVCRVQKQRSKTNKQGKFGRCVESVMKSARCKSKRLSS
jgi:hypothetical protein